MHGKRNKHTFSVQVGKQFDALLIDTQAPDASDPVFYTFSRDSMAVSLSPHSCLFIAHMWAQEEMSSKLCLRNHINQAGQ